MLGCHPHHHHHLHEERRVKQVEGLFVPFLVVNYKKRMRLSFRIDWTCLRWTSLASCSARGNLKVGASSMLQGVNKVGDLSEMPWLILGFFGRFSPGLNCDQSWETIFVAFKEVSSCGCSLDSISTNHLTLRVKWILTLSSE